MPQPTARRHQSPSRLMPVLALGALMLIAVVVAIRAIPVSVKVATATRGPLLAAFSADGYVESNSVDLAALITSPVEQIFVTEGQRVRAGAPLVRLMGHDAQTAAVSARADLQAAIAAQDRAARTADEALAQQQLVESGAAPQDVAQARQVVVQASADSASSQRALIRAQKLYADGAISRAAFEDAQTQAQISEARARQAADAYQRVTAGARSQERTAAADRLAAAEAGLNESRASVEAAAAAARGAQLDLMHTIISAPFDGIVDRVWVRQGSLVSPQAPVITLATEKNMRVSVDFDEEDAAKVHVGTAVRLEVPGYPGRLLSGRIARLAATASVDPTQSSRSRIIRADVLVDNTASLLKSGMRVDVRGEGVVSLGTLKIPSDSLHFSNGQNVVFVVRAGRAQLRAVDVGYVSDQVAEIIGGLHAGDVVVVGDLPSMTDGQRVRINGTVAVP